MNTFGKSNENTVDNLTKVFTQEYMKDYANYLISKRVPFSYLIVDFDNFKVVNSSYSRQAGDEVLKMLACKMREVAEDWGTIGRFEGDKFIIICNEVKYETVWQNCRNLSLAVADMQFEKYKGLYLTATIGLARFPEDAENFDELIEKTQKAIYRGKTKGRNCFIIYNKEKHENIVVESTTDNSMTSTYLHTMIFHHLAESKNFADGIKGLFEFFGSFLGLEHICIQSDNKILFENYANLDTSHKFEPVDLKTIRNLMSNTTEIFSFNGLPQIDEPYGELKKSFEAQGIQSSMICNIASHMKNFGVIRINQVSKKYVWQPVEKDLFTTAGRFIGYYLWEHNLSLDDLK